MSGIIWLITEDEGDFKAVREIFRAKNTSIRIKWLKVACGSGGIFRLLDQLETLIAYAFSNKSDQDCIAVLHDADIHKQPHRETYDEIRRICKKHKVYHAIAEDELEAWILADAGICEWLGIKHEIWDKDSKPSNKLGCVDI